LRRHDERGCLPASGGDARRDEWHVLLVQLRADEGRPEFCKGALEDFVRRVEIVEERRDGEGAWMDR